MLSRICLGSTSFASRRALSTRFPVLKKEGVKSAQRQVDDWQNNNTKLSKTSFFPEKLTTQKQSRIDINQKNLGSVLLGRFFSATQKFCNFFLDKDMQKMFFACDKVGNLDLLL